MKTDTVQQVKDRLSINDVVGQYVKLERSGSNFRARCPFHSERTPSFFISPARGTYHCFGCGVGGDIFTFIQEVEGLDFKGALKVLAERAGVPLVYEAAERKDERERLHSLMEEATLFFQKRIDSLPDVGSYLAQRGLTKETLSAFRIGWAPGPPEGGWRELSDHLKQKGYSEGELEYAGLVKRSEKGIYDRFRSRIMFPLADSAGRIVGFSGRILSSETHPEAPKYINSPETPLYHKSKILYGYDRAKHAIRKYDCAVLVEGQMDLLMSYQAGWTNTVAASGTALTPEHVTLLSRMSGNLVIALDADEAGIAAAQRSAKEALAYGLDVKIAALPSGLDPADLIRTQGADAWRDAIRGAEHVILFLLRVLQGMTKDNRQFEKIVEHTILPFVAAIKSPIDQERFVREIGKRTGISETAIRETLEHMPTEEYEDTKQGATVETRMPRAREGMFASRAHQLFGVFLWYMSLTSGKDIPIERFEERVQDALGDERYAQMHALSETEQEALRFAAEAFYTGHADGEAHIERDIETLLRMVARDRLQNELIFASSELRRAEGSGDESAIEAALAHCALLTGEIAKLDNTR
jgi:DNA primase